MQAPKRFLAVIERPIFVVNQQNSEVAVRMMREERVDENPRVSQIIARNDCAGADHRWQATSLSEGASACHRATRE